MSEETKGENTTEENKDTSIQEPQQESQAEGQDSQVQSEAEIRTDEKKEEASELPVTESAVEEKSDSAENQTAETLKEKPKEKKKSASKGKKGKKNKSEKQNIENPSLEEKEGAENIEEPKEASKDSKIALSKTEKVQKAVKKAKNAKNLRLDVGGSYEKLQSNVPVLVFTCIAALIVMVMVCAAVFFMNVKGPEQVLVPNVVGKKWDEALLEMQIKELYPRINLRYSEQIGDEGSVLEQDPEAGAIVKGYSRVSLVISRGVVVDEVGDYIGKNITEVQMSLQTLFAGQTRPLITLSDVEYVPDNSEAGTVLEQDPPAGYKISQPVSVQLVVSRGPTYENTRRPYVIGQTINDLLQTITRSKLVFDITSHEAAEGETPGTVVNQQQISDEYVPNYTRVSVEMAMPSKAVGENIYGVFQAQLSDYPYPVPMRLAANPPEGEAYTILNFSHPGGNVTVPYSVVPGTVLTLYVNERVVERQTVN